MSAAAPSDALAASMLFRKNALGSAVSGENENAGCRILLPCLKQLQVQLNGTETMKTSKVKTGILEVPLADHDRTTARIQSDYFTPADLERRGSMTLCVAMLIASEFMPVSLLTPMAADLRTTEGMAGQAISVSGLFAVGTSLFIAAIAGRLAGRYVLIGLTCANAGLFDPDRRTAESVTRRPHLGPWQGQGKSTIFVVAMSLYK